MKRLTNIKVSGEEVFVEAKQQLKDTFKKPSMLSAKKAPTGRGETAGDQLVRRLAVEFGYDPISELVKTARSAKTSPELKTKINMELVQYYLPKIRAVDTNPNAGEVISINVIPSTTIPSTK